MDFQSYFGDYRRVKRVLALDLKGVAPNDPQEGPSGVAKIRLEIHAKLRSASFERIRAEELGDFAKKKNDEDLPREVRPMASAASNPHRTFIRLLFMDGP